MIQKMSLQHRVAFLCSFLSLCVSCVCAATCEETATSQVNVELAKQNINNAKALYPQCLEDVDKGNCTKKDKSLGHLNSALHLLEDAQNLCPTTYNPYTFYHWTMDWHSAVSMCERDNKRLLCYKSRQEIDDITETFRLSADKDAELDIWMSSRNCSSQNKVECLSLHIRKSDNRVWHFFQENCEQMFPFVCFRNESDKPQEFRNILSETGPLLQEKFYHFVKSRGGPGKAKDNSEFWNSYENYKCKMTFLEKEQFFCALMIEGGDHMAFHCQKDPMGEECQKMEKGALVVEDMMRRYYVDGSCSMEGAKKLTEEMEKLKAGASNLKKIQLG